MALRIRIKSHESRHPCTYIGVRTHTVTEAKASLGSNREKYTRKDRGIQIQEQRAMSSQCLAWESGEAGLVWASRGLGLLAT